MRVMTIRIVTGAKRKKDHHWLPNIHLIVQRIQYLPSNNLRRSQVRRKMGHYRVPNVMAVVRKVQYQGRK